MAGLLGAFSGQTKWNCLASTHRRFLLCVSWTRDIMPIHWTKVLSAHNFPGAIKSIQLLSASRRLPPNEILWDQIAWAQIDRTQCQKFHSGIWIWMPMGRCSVHNSMRHHWMTSWAHDFLLGIPMMGGENTKKWELNWQKSFTYEYCGEWN